MAAAMQPFNVWLLSLTKDTLRFLKPTLTQDIFEGSTQIPHPEGLFSTEIYGRVGDESRDTTFSYIPLGATILHPLVFRTLGRLKSLYRDIMLGTKFATWDAEAHDFVSSNPIDGRTGYAFFMEHYLELEFPQNRSETRQLRVQMLNKFRKEALTENVLVIPAGLRDIEVRDGRVAQDEINDYYRTLLSISNVFKGLSGTKEDAIFDTSRKSAQIAFNSIYDYLENMISGKKGLIQAKWARRSVFNGTRNVLSAMDTSCAVLGDARAVKPTQTQLGYYQLMKAALPVTQFELKNGWLSQVFGGGSSVMLTDPDTWEAVQVDVSTDTLDRWDTNEGLEKVITSFEKPGNRNKPIKIEGHYLGLVYVDKYRFKIFNDINDLPENFSRDNVSPLTLAQLLYISCNKRLEKIYGFITRYPVTGAGSIYPSHLYGLTTDNATRKIPLDDGWQPMGEEYAALEFPSSNPVDGWNDTMIPHLIMLAGLGADFDGDTGSVTAVYSPEATAECQNYLGMKRAWVDGNGLLLPNLDLPAIELVLHNITGI
jgi:hypothetical protein